MMIRTAGGPGLVSPIDFHERRGPGLSRNAWIAIGVVAAAHLGVGAALYYQRFELELPPAAPAPSDPFRITLDPPPKPVTPEMKPAAPNPPIHKTPAPTTETPVLPLPPMDNPSVPTGPTITLTGPVANPVDHAPPAAEPQPEPAAPVIRNPSWARQPTGEQMMRAYPDRALERGVGGTATLNCLVQANGSIAGCDVTGETPAGQGFGRAAQSLSRHFRINPRTVDGAATGSRVVVNLRFVPPAE